MVKDVKWPIPLGSKPIDLELERVDEALTKMGNPHHFLPPVIHIAGTNGKGSTLAFLNAILEDAGFKCHIYTSPHLVEFNERIVLAGKQISDEFLNDILEETEKLTEGTKLTYFEGTTLAAILAFSKVKADFVLLETGLGGRLDATNIMGRNNAPVPALNIITPISYDHTEFLGDTLQKIAYEKAHIMKKGVKTVIAEQPEVAFKVIEDVSNEIGSELVVFGKDFNLPVYELSLLGKHQKVNAATAIAAVKNLGLVITEDNIKHGLKNAVWPARMQNISDRFLVKNAEIWLDGGHNQDGAKVINQVASDWKEQDKKTYAVIGMVKTKIEKEFLEEIKNAFDGFYFIEIPEEPNSKEPQVLYNSAKELGIGNASIAKNIDAAIAKIAEEKDNNKNILICGSLYLAGWVLGNYKSLAKAQ